MADANGSRSSIADELRDLNVGATSADYVLAHAFDRLVGSVDALRREIAADRDERRSSDTARTLALFAVAGSIIVALVGAIAGQVLLGVSMVPHI